jgi:hypothetical protein
MEATLTTDKPEPATTSMRLRPEDHAVLRECRRLSGLSRTECVRQALKLYLAKLRREAKFAAK